jgi:hypothetical protein
MKTYQKTATGKLTMRFDNELKRLLIEELKSFKEKNRFLNGYNNQVTDKQLSAA